MNMNAFKARAVKAFMYTQHAFEFFVERQGMRKIFKINKNNAMGREGAP